MGANASTPGDGATGDANGTRQSTTKNSGPDDLYELLNVDPQANAEEIRKAFRKEALKWHPDKNAGSVEASQRFVKIQAAYDVLSDDQERAYYDAHRGDIGEDDLEDESQLRERAARASASKTSVRISSKQLTRFFDPTLWNGDFSDGPNSFYAIYRTLFDTISESELYATAPAGEPALSAPPVKYPSFGNSYMQYDGSDGTLKKFYGTFLSFSSRRPFNEADQYRLQDAPDRRVRRLMEKENKHVRDDARKQYSEAVRSLASFLKKRDPRFLNSTSSDPLRVKQLEKQKLQAQLRDAALEAARKREENAKSYKEQAWQRVPTGDSEDELSDSDGDEEADERVSEGNELEDAASQDGLDEVQDWFCPACEKDFASQGAWDNHERSKKHLKNMEKLRREMQEEEFELGLSQQDVQDLSIQGDGDDVPTPIKSRKDKKRGKRKNGFELDPEVVADIEEAGMVHQSDGDHQQPAASAEEMPAAAEADEATNGSQTPELSKREKRRAREAAKKASGTSTPAEICNVCQETFSSRTKLFSHIKETGHAAAVQATEGSGKSGRKGKRL